MASERHEFYQQLTNKVLRAGKPLVLGGRMGAGKTAVGSRIALKLNLPFVDSDREIEESAQMQVSDIFATYGEKEFRRLEKRVIMRILENPEQIISTGGGVLTTAESRAAIQSRAISLWLRVESSEILNRILRKNNRPLLQTENPAEIIEKLLGERQPYYAAADLTIDSQPSAEETCDYLLDRLDLYLSRADSPLVSAAHNRVSNHEG
ncbi:MAG: shikimate kinase [Alphaproteobacteria bacterium]|nr:shikimate kinase [Alphaproteobacteria bacterium]